MASTIIGVTSPERVKQTMDWAAHTIPEVLWNELAALPVDMGDPEATRVYKLGEGKPFRSPSSHPLQNQREWATLRNTRRA